MKLSYALSAMAYGLAEANGQDDATYIGLGPMINGFRTVGCGVSLYAWDNRWPPGARKMTVGRLTVAWRGPRPGGSGNMTFRELPLDETHHGAIVAASVAVLGWIALAWLASCLLTFGPSNACDACVRECGDRPDCRASCEARQICAPEEAP